MKKHHELKVKITATPSGTLAKLKRDVLSEAMNNPLPFVDENDPEYVESPTMQRFKNFKDKPLLLVGSAVGIGSAMHAAMEQLLHDQDYEIMVMGSEAAAKRFGESHLQPVCDEVDLLSGLQKEWKLESRQIRNEQLSYLDPVVGYSNKKTSSPKKRTKFDQLNDSRNSKNGFR